MSETCGLVLLLLPLTSLLELTFSLATLAALGTMDGTLQMDPSAAIVFSRDSDVIETFDV